ncbi:MAG: hypothetical protein Q8P99_01195 [bacterium]|nr:hypothetical protein [bacterium]MDZ4231183.1 hypothetical protein [Patescibacteria group bacterium]
MGLGSIEKSGSKYEASGESDFNPEEDLLEASAKLEDPSEVIKATALLANDVSDSSITKAHTSELPQKEPISYWTEKVALEFLRDSLRGTDVEKVLENFETADIGELVMELIDAIIQQHVDGNRELFDRDELEEVWSSAEFLKELAHSLMDRASREIIKLYGGPQGVIKKGIELTEEQKGISEAIASIRYKLFSALGLNQLDTDDIQAALRSRLWYSESVYETMDETMDLSNKTLDAMIKLETLRPGAVKMLHDTYGIRFFGRYDLWKLIDQIDGKLDHRRKVLYTAASDRNGAFDHMYSRMVLFDDDNNRIVVEGATLMEIGRRLVRLSRQIGPIEELVIAGHGTASGVRLGENTRLEQSQVVRSKGLTRLTDRKVISATTSVIFMSCKTGARKGMKKGIASSFAKQTGVRVYAPKHNSSGGFRKMGGKVEYNIRTKKGKRRTVDTRMF